jgi:hypothetical protein
MQPRRQLFRRQLIVPTEHGSWSWFLVPWATGAAVSGQVGAPVLLTLVAGLAIFLMRQPATIWFRVRRGRARQSDGSLAVAWIVGLACVALLAVAGLLWLDRAALLWLAGPLGLVFFFYLLAARYGRAGLRTLWMELTGAAALAMTAPAALVAAHGNFNGQEWALWAVMAAQNMLGALYVRLRIHDTHQRPINRTAIAWAHGIGLGAVIMLGLREAIPSPAALPFAGFWLRAAWAAASPRPIADVKRFGFREMGVEILSGAWIATSYWIWG